MALRAKNRPDKAEPEGCGGSTVKGENEVWPVFSPQPSGPVPLFPISESLVASRHPVCVTPHSLNSQKLAPGATVRLVLTGPSRFTDVFSFDPAARDLSAASWRDRRCFHTRCSAGLAHRISGRRGSWPTAASDDSCPRRI